MPLFLPNLARRAVGEAERLLSSVLAPVRDHGAAVARLREDVAEQRGRADRLERRLAEQAEELAAARRQIDSLVEQLNGRLLPGIDERIHETERDLTRLATRLLRAGQDAARQQSLLAAVEQRAGDLRDRVGRLEERTGIWRELQANVARLGEDLDTVRARMTRPREAAEAGELGGNGRNGHEVHP
ncbi:hypothetical protein [Thermomonospora umbrina]|uniref:Uncharacterized protein n=1 Tax=Thermomonospora umbrina TaxID=111806 RepID=A0A3D9ST47_9ACTN|nr:hypothetical protein [Thermomonospora umbrina]REE94871.1 hypothetical protein DFJ69_0240 [Thermomonospora umbrina]